MPLRTLAAIALALFFQMADPAGISAAVAARVILLANAPGDPLLRRLSAEIRSVGLEVLVVQTEGNLNELSQLEVQARQHEGIAAVEIFRRSSGVEIRIFDRVTGKFVIRRLGRSSADPAADGPMVALRAVELLRGSLLEIRAPRAPESELAAPPAVEAMVSRVLPADRDRSGIALGTGLLASPGGASVAAVARLAFLWWHWPKVALGVSADLPYISGKLEGAEGRARVRPFILQVAVQYSSRPVGEPGGFLAGGVEAGALWLLLDSESLSPGFRGPGSQVGAGLFGLRGQLGYGVGTWLRLSLEARVAAALPWPEIRFADQPRGDFGLPLSTLSVVAEMYWR